jgi:Ran GTPase-activating protein (RanGAP) involved in mRNA processing and transport
LRLRANDASTTSVDLNYNLIGDNGVAFVAAMLVGNTVLTLNLGGNNITDTGAACLNDALKVNSMLTELNLFDNHISSTGADRLADALKVNNVLTELSL